MFSVSKFEHNYTKSLFKYEEPISKDFKVLVNGQEATVYTCRISKNPINAHWPGHQRSVDQSELASFVNIVSDEAVTLEVVPTSEYSRVMVRPYSKNIPFTDENGKITFTLKEEGQFVLALDDLHNSLFIFNTKPIECSDPQSVTHYFGPGIHLRKNLVLHSNESVYVDKDALVFGNIYAEDAENIHIFGNGIFDDSGEGRFADPCYENYTIGNMRLYDCKNVRVEGVLFRDSAGWCVTCYHCFDVVYDNIENINVEYNNFDEVPQLQTKDYQTYEPTDEVMVPFLICITNTRFRKEYSDVPYIKALNLNNAIDTIDFGTTPHGMVRDVKFNNINVYYDQGIPDAGTKYNIPIRIWSVLDDVTFRNISISGIKVNGEKVCMEDLKANITETENFTYTI